MMRAALAALAMVLVSAAAQAQAARDEDVVFAAGKASPVQRFTRNTLCALVSPKVDVTPQTLVDPMLDPAFKLGTSTPKADPSGDYAVMMFERVEQQGRKGAFEALNGKALHLTDGPNSPPSPAGKSVYGVLGPTARPISSSPTAPTRWSRRPSSRV